MKLTRVERWMLSNQYRILAALYPKERDWYDKKREALEDGYEFHYAPDHIVSDEQVTTDEECREVIDILAMFDGLRLSYKELADKSGVEKSSIRFGGFDGNNEAKQMGYAQYFCSLDGGRFKEVVKGVDFNSHAPTLWHYRPMLREFKAIRKAMDLNKDEILRVVNAARAVGP